MVPDLPSLASEVLSRLEGTPLPSGPPQLLACSGERCLVRSSEGVREWPIAGLSGNFAVAHLLDHTLLKPGAKADEIDRLCEEALAHGFASVCVNPVWVARCARRLAGSRVRVCTVVGFPLGANTTTIKVRETVESLELGAAEIDFVLALGLVKGGEWAAVGREFRDLRRASSGYCLKVILENCLLDEDEKRRACAIALEEGLDFVKTSTGFSTGGATRADVSLMRGVVGDRMGVKASGGIRDRDAALAMLGAGATRLGVSASLVIL